jgi:predicted PolB exonuclease-like 3'-5' exonuclease
MNVKNSVPQGKDRLDDRNVQLYYKRVNIVSINFYRYNATENNTTNCG